MILQCNFKHHARAVERRKTTLRFKIGCVDKEFADAHEYGYNFTTLLSLGGAVLDPTTDQR